MHEQHIGRGVAYGVVAAISYSIMSLFSKMIGDGASTDAILFARFFISFLLILPWVIKNPKETLHVTKLSPLIMRSIGTLVAVALFFYALKYLPLSNALLLNNTFPLFVPIVAWIAGRHHTPYKVWIGIIIGFIGVGLVLQPSSGSFQMASWIALASGIVAGITIFMIRMLTKTTTTVQILFYNFLICTLLTAVFLPFGWQSFGWEILLWLIGVGIFGTIYQAASTLSYAKAPARLTSPLMFLCILFGVLFDYLIWHDAPDWITISGMCLVIIGGVITIYFGQKEIMQK